MWSAMTKRLSTYGRGSTMDELSKSLKAASSIRTDVALIAALGVTSVGIAWACAKALTIAATWCLGGATVLAVLLPGLALLLRTIRQSPLERMIQTLLGDPALRTFIERQFQSAAAAIETSTPQRQAAEPQDMRLQTSSVRRISSVRRPSPQPPETSQIEYLVSQLQRSRFSSDPGSALRTAAVISLLSSQEMSTDGRALASFQLGNYYRSIGQNKVAIDCYSSAANLFPSWPEAHFNLGIALSADGRYSEAAGSLRTVLQLVQELPTDNSPDRYFLGRIRFFLGRCLGRLGETQEARTHLDEAVALLQRNPEDPRSMEVLRWAQQELSSMRR